MLGLTKDGREKGSGAGGQHLLRGRDGHHGAPGSPLPHPALLSEHTTHRLNPGRAQSFQTFPHLSCFQALLTTHTLSFQTSAHSATTRWLYCFHHNLDLLEMVLKPVKSYSYFKFGFIFNFLSRHFHPSFMWNISFFEQNSQIHPARRGLSVQFHPWTINPKGLDPNTNGRKPKSDKPMLENLDWKCKWTYKDRKV